MGSARFAGSQGKIAIVQALTLSLRSAVGAQAFSRGLQPTVTKTAAGK
jgi:hypothetical protein